MKKIFLVRHGQAANITAAESDRDRPLTNKGVSDVFRVGKSLFERTQTPGLIIASPAVRAEATAKLIAEQTKYELPQILINEDIYRASVGSFLKIINQLSDDYDTLVMVGHNPTISYFTEYLTGEEGINLQPASCAEIHLEVANWADVSEEMGTLAWYEDVY